MTKTTTTATAPTTDSPDWSVYHGSPLGSGAASSVTAVDTSTPAWTSPQLTGQLYGEPLVSGGRVYVATEDDVVYALSSTTGAVVWSTRVAQPVPSADLPCGDIQPTVGITGTPVIDPDRGEIFVVADELVAGRSAHVLVGLDLTTGRTELTQVVDPPGASPAALLQRTGLTLVDGQVVFGFGGNYGDCASYRGRVVAVPESGGTPLYFTVDAAAGQSQGAVWMGGGAPAVDASGNIWVEVGNGSVSSASRAYDDSDSLLELSPSLHLEQYFAPSSWPADNAADLDMSMEPALLADGQILVAGKSRIGYLLRASDLGGIGGQQATRALPCSEDIDGGVATVGTTVYLPCLSGVMAVGVGASPASLRVLWSSGRGGGPPIVAAGLVWTVGQDGVLYGLDPSTGAVTRQATVGSLANHFPTPRVGAGRQRRADHHDPVDITAGGTGGRHRGRGDPDRRCRRHRPRGAGAPRRRRMGLAPPQGRTPGGPGLAPQGATGCADRSSPTSQSSPGPAVTTVGSRGVASVSRPRARDRR